jgi:hypothetical protein
MVRPPSPRLRACALAATGFLLPLDAQDVGLGDLARIRPGVSRRASSAHPDALSNHDNKWIGPGERFVMADLRGPGAITHIWMTFAGPEPGWLSKDGSADHSEVVLRMYWDGADAPAVEAPIGDFFAAGFGERVPVESAAVVVEGGDAYNCYWRMPFFTRARIEVENQGAKRFSAFYYHVDWEELPSLPDGTPYFCAQYNQAFPERLGEEYLILDAEGLGHYVGTVLSVRSRTPSWFGEGDEKFWIDGEERPSVWGTGTEDYFQCAWGLEECVTPYFGCTLMDGGFGMIGTRYSLYRWHVQDPVRFTKSLRFTIEHNGWVRADECEGGVTGSHFEREDDAASVAFWYQVGQPKRFAVLPSAAERRLPELDTVVYEGKVLLERARRGEGHATLQRGHGWTGDGQVFFRNEGVGGFLEFDFDVTAGHKHALVLRLTRSFDYGIWSVAVDGEVVAPRVDLYEPATKVRDLQLDVYNLAPGTHTVRFECVGQNPLSRGAWIGVDSVRLRKRWDKLRPDLHRLLREGQGR